MEPTNDNIISTAASNDTSKQQSNPVIEHHENTVMHWVNAEKPDRDPAGMQEKAGRPSWTTIMAIFFLGLSLVAPVGLVINLTSAILAQIGLSLNDLNYTWLVGGYGVSTSVAFGLAGSLSDIFGRRHIMLIGNAFVLLGGIIGAVSHDMMTLIAATTVTGFGCGLVFVAYAGIPELVPNKYRGIGLAWAELALLLPWGGLSVLLAVEINKSAGWRWIYYITITYSVVCIAGLYVFYFPPARPQEDFDRSRLQELLSLDFLGVILYTLGLTIFLIGVTWAGSDGHPWKSVSVIAPIILGLAVLGICLGYESFFATAPLFPPSLLSQWRKFTMLLLVVFVAGMCYFTLVTLLPQAILFMFTKDTSEIGIISIPAGLGQVFFGFLVPLLIHRIKRVKTQLIVSTTLQTVAIGLFSIAVPHRRAAFMVLEFFAPGCFPWIVVITYLTVSLHVPQKQLGLAIGLLGTLRSAGGSVGNAIFASILRSVVDSQLGPKVTEAALEAGFPPAQLNALIPATIQAGYGTPDSFASIPGATTQVQEAVLTAFAEAYGYAFRRVFWSIIPFGIVAIVAACLVEDPSDALTNHTSVHLEKEVLGHRSDVDAKIPKLA